MNSDLNSVFVQMLLLCHGILCVWGFISLSFILACCCLSLLVFGVCWKCSANFTLGLE